MHKAKICKTKWIISLFPWNIKTSLCSQLLRCNNALGDHPKRKWKKKKKIPCFTRPQQNKNDRKHAVCRPTTETLYALQMKMHRAFNVSRTVWGFALKLIVIRLSHQPYISDLKFPMEGTYSSSRNFEFSYCFILDMNKFYSILRKRSRGGSLSNAITLAIVSHGTVHGQFLKSNWGKGFKI